MQGTVLRNSGRQGCRINNFAQRGDPLCLPERSEDVQYQLCPQQSWMHQDLQTTTSTRQARNLKKKRKAILLNKKSHSVRVGCDKGAGRGEEVGLEIQLPKKRLFRLQEKGLRGFPGGPVARTLHFQCWGPGFNPWSRNYVPQAATNCTYATTKGLVCLN